MAFGGGAQKGVRSEINVTPLVDVVLVLLIIFMVMTPAMLKEMPMEIPDKAEVEIVTPTITDQVVVAVSAAGTVKVNNETVAQPQLAARLTELLASRNEKLVFFDISDDARYEDAVHVMDLARGAGAKTLGLMTKD